MLLLITLLRDRQTASLQYNESQLPQQTDGRMSGNYDLPSYLLSAQTGKLLHSDTSSGKNNIELFRIVKAELQKSRMQPSHYLSTN